MRLPPTLDSSKLWQSSMLTSFSFISTPTSLFEGMVSVKEHTPTPYTLEMRRNRSVLNWLAHLGYIAKRIAPASTYPRLTDMCLGWRLLFSTSWGRFERRFNNIFEDLARHEQLVDKEAIAYDIAAATEMRQEIRTWKEESIEQVIREEKRQAAKEFRSLVSWLKVDEVEQIRIYETISDEGTKFPGTCSWLTRNEKIKCWLQKRPDPPLLWLHGNPGCGKSVIAADLVRFLNASGLPIIHHFCTYTYESSTKYDGILRSILQQLLRRSGELVAYVYTEFILGKKPPTTGNLERLIEMLVAALSDEPRETQYLWIIIDGVNECEGAKKSRLISLMNQISSISTTDKGVVCKVLLTTRSPIKSKYPRKDQVLSLSDESSILQSAIRIYVGQRMGSLHDKLRQLEFESDEIVEIEDLISKKAGGETIRCFNSIPL